MTPQEQEHVTPARAAAPAQEFYLPTGGGTDPDFFIPADCDRTDRGFSRWLRALPVFGRQRP